MEGFRERRPMTDEEILAALEAMGRGERPEDPSEPVERQFSVDPETVIGNDSPSDVEVFDSRTAGRVRTPEIVSSGNFSKEGEPVSAPPPKSRGLKSMREFESSVPPVDLEKEEMSRLLQDYEDSLNKDKKKNTLDRMQYWNVKAGEAVSSGVAGLGKNDIGPLPDRDKEAPGKKDMFNMRETQRSHDLTSQKGDKDRLQKVYTAQENNLSHEAVADASITAKRELQDDKQTHDFEKQKRDNAAKKQRAEIAARAMIGSKAMGITAQSSDRVNREVYETAAKQAERQIRDYVWEHPVSSKTHEDVSEMIRAKERAKLLAAQAKDLLEYNPHAQAFWGTEARAKLKAAIIEAAQSNVKFEGNGVANGRDIENSLMSMGNLDSPESFITGNGITALNQFIENLDGQADAVVASQGGRRRRAGEAYNQLPDVNMFNSGSGATIGQDPNTVGGMADWVVGKKDSPPALRDPSRDPRMNKGQSGSRAGKTAKIVNGKVVYQ